MYGFQPKSARGKTVPKLADGGAVPFGSRGVASVRELIPKMQAMGFQPAAPTPADTSNTARLRAMIPQMEAMGYKQQPQNLADGGMVHSIKGMLGLRPKTREELLAADAKAQARNQEAAARVTERAAAQQPAPATSAPQSAITDYTGMSAMQRREKEQGLENGGMVKPRGFKAGGLILGPGTGTSDSIETEKRPGTFIMPADSTQAIGPDALEELGEPMDAVEGGQGMEADGTEEEDEGKEVPVRLSNGEFELPPEQVQALGEAVLTVLRNATHERSEEQQKAMPKAAGFAPRQFFADGGMIENDVTRVGNSYSGGNVGGSVSINGQVGSGTVSTVPAPVASAPAPAEAPAAAVASANTSPVTPSAASAAPASAAPAQAAPMGWAERNAQRSNQVTASSIMDSPDRRAAQAALAPAPVAAPAPAIGLDATKPKPFGVQPPAFGTPAGFQPRGYANGGTVQDDEKQRLANQTAMYVQGAQAQAASRPAAPVVTPAPAAPAPAPAAPKAAGFMPGTRAVFNESGKAIGDLAKQGRYAAAAGETARAALAYGPAVVDDVVGGALRSVAPTVVDAGKQFFGAGETTPAPASTPSTKTASPTTPPAPPAPAQPAAVSATPAVETTAAPAAQPLTAGPISTQNNAAAEALSTPRAAGFVPGGAGTALPAPVVRNSTNDWAARKALENAATAASSITANGGRFDQNGPAGSPQAAAYRSALATDQALQQAQPGMEQAAMRENGANQRTAVQDAGATTRTVIQDQGATTREAGRTALAQGEQEMRRTAAGFQTRAAAQQEALRNVLLDPKATPEQRKVAQRSLVALSGKTAADRMQVVNLPDTVTDQGVVAKGGQALVRTLEDGTVERVPIAGQSANTTQQFKQGEVYRDAAGNTRRWNGKAWEKV